MKMSFLVTGISLVALIITGSAIHPDNSMPVFQAAPEDSSSIPPEILGIMGNSCLGCHADGGKPLAMGKLNFSEWDAYSSSKKAKKAEAICNELTEGNMPPRSFIKSNPGAVLTKEQMDSICMWTKTVGDVK